MRKLTLGASIFIAVLFGVLVALTSALILAIVI